MKLLHFLSAPTTETNLKVQNIGRALAVKSIPEAEKPTKKEPVSLKGVVDMDGDGDIDSMDAAIMTMVHDHKVAASKIKRYD